MGGGTLNENCGVMLLSRMFTIGDDGVDDDDAVADG